MKHLIDDNSCGPLDVDSDESRGDSGDCAAQNGDSFLHSRRRYLFLIQWFATPRGGGYFESLSRRFAQEGDAVETLTGAYPFYFCDGGDSKGEKKSDTSKKARTETLDVVRVVRVPSYQSHSKSGWKRILSYSSFGLSAATLGLFRISRPDVVFCYTFPTLRWAARAARFLFGAKIVVFALDLWPESVADSGMMRNRFLLRVLSRWCVGFYRSADAVVVPSPGIKRKLIERGVAPEKIFFLYLWTDESANGTASTGVSSSAASKETPFVSSVRERTEPEEVANENGGAAGRPLTILYAGNVGTAQALDVVLDAARLLENENANVVFRLVGGGVDWERMKKRAADLGIKNVVFRDRVSAAEIAVEYERADALLTHLKKTELFKITIPSKTQAYLRAGRPILCGVAGDASDVVAQANAGISFEPENPSDLARAVRELGRRTPEERERLGRNGADFYREKTSFSAARRRLEDLWKFLFPNVDG